MLRIGPRAGIGYTTMHLREVVLRIGPRAGIGYTTMHLREVVLRVGPRAGISRAERQATLHLLVVRPDLTSHDLRHS